MAVRFLWVHLTEWSTPSIARTRTRIQIRSYLKSIQHLKTKLCLTSQFSEQLKVFQTSRRSAWTWPGMFRVTSASTNTFLLWSQGSSRTWTTPTKTMWQEILLCVMVRLPALEVTNTLEVLLLLHQLDWRTISNLATYAATRLHKTCAQTTWSKSNQEKKKHLQWPKTSLLLLRNSEFEDYYY